MANLIQVLTENGEAVVAILTALVTLASAVANFTAKDSDNKAVAIFAKVVDFIALNFKK